MAFLGASIQYVSCVLGVKYRKQNEEGEYVGGPMYYLRDGLGFKNLQLCSLFLQLWALLRLETLRKSILLLFLCKKWG